MPHTIKTRRALPSAALTSALCIALVGCGGSGGSTTIPSPSAPLGGGTPGIEGFGHAATPARRASVATALLAYTSALADDDGAAACARLQAGLREQLQGVGAATHRGHPACASLVTSMFAEQGARQRNALRGTTVVAVRLTGNRGFAIVHQPAMPAGFFPVADEGGQWRVGAIGVSR